MSLATRIQKAVDGSMRRLDSISKPATYIQRGDTDLSSYDPATGALAVSQDLHSLRVVLAGVTDREVDRYGLKPSDRKALFSRAGFPFEPGLEDVLRVDDGPDAGSWEVVQVMPESTESSVVLAVRRR